MYRHLRSKKIKIGKTIEMFENLPDNIELKITSEKDGTLNFPVFLLYDQFMGSDFIQTVHESTTLRKFLTPVFAVQSEWDKEHEYRMDSIEVYFHADQTKPIDPKDYPKKKSTKKYIKCDLKQTLLEVLAHDNHIIPQYPLFKIISSENDYKDAFLNEI